MEVIKKFINKIFVPKRLIYKSKLYRITKLINTNYILEGYTIELLDGKIFDVIINNKEPMVVADIHKNIPMSRDWIYKNLEVLKGYKLVEQGSISNYAKAIVEVLKVEDKDLQVDTKVYDGLEVREEVLMNLKEVTIMVVTEKAIMVVKRGYQKWIPKSQIKDSDAMTFVEGVLVEDIPLTDKAEKWIPNESWEKYEVKKR